MGQRYEHVSLDERCEIGRLMGRSASTISRDLERNRLPVSGYQPASAERMALARRRRLPKIERLAADAQRIVSLTFYPWIEKAVS